MTATIPNVLEAVRAKIASSSGIEITLGTPHVTGPGLSMFPYLLAEGRLLRDAPSEPTAGKAARRLALNCLLLPNSVDSYGDIGEGLRCLQEHCLVNLESKVIRATILQLSVDELAQLFISTGIRHRLAIPFQLEWTE